MKIDQRIFNAFLLMLGSGQKITVYSLAEKSGVDRNSIYYRIRKLITKNERF